MKESAPKGKAVKEAKDHEIRDQSRYDFETLELITDRRVLREGRANRNHLSLSRGDFRGFTVNKVGTHIKGVGAGTKITGPATVKQNCVLDGLYFSSADAVEPLITLEGDATLILRHCILEKRANDTSTYIAIDSNAEVLILIGCWFRGTPPAGDIITYPGAAPTINVIGCMRDTIAGHNYAAAFTNIGSV